MGTKHPLISALNPNRNRQVCYYHPDLPKTRRPGIIPFPSKKDYEPGNIVKIFLLYS
jgi:hypothetical protein